MTSPYLSWIIVILGSAIVAFIVHMAFRLGRQSGKRSAQVDDMLIVQRVSRHGCSDTCSSSRDIMVWQQACANVLNAFERKFEEGEEGHE